jgi:ribosomal protein S27E
LEQQNKSSEHLAVEAFTIAVTCPSCGGAITFIEGRTKVVCKHCGLSYVVLGNEGLKRYYIPKMVRREEALRSLRKFVKSKIIDEERKRDVRLIDAKLAYVPVYRVKVKGGGVYIGMEEREVIYQKPAPETNEVIIVKKPKKFVNGTVLKQMSYFVPALDVSEFGVFGISTKSSVLKLHVFDEDLVSAKWMVFDPLEEPEIALEKAWAVLSSSLKPQGLNLLYFELQKVKEEISQIYYPLYLVRFLLDGVAIRAVVDGLGGDVIRARIPKKNVEFNPVPGVLVLSLVAFILTLFPGIYFAIPVFSIVVFLTIFGINRFLRTVNILFFPSTESEDYTVG